MSKVLSCCFRRTHNSQANNKNTFKRLGRAPGTNMNSQARTSLRRRRKTLEIIKSGSFFGGGLFYENFKAVYLSKFCGANEAGEAEGKHRPRESFLKEKAERKFDEIWMEIYRFNVGWVTKISKWLMRSFMSELRWWNKKFNQSSSKGNLLITSNLRHDEVCGSLEEIPTKLDKVHKKFKFELHEPPDAGTCTISASFCQLFPNS